MFARESILKWCVALAATFLLTACDSRQQPKSFVNQLTAGDSLSIGMGDWTLTKYHSDRLSLDINYPSFLVRQELLPEDGPQEVFLWQDVSVSVIVDSLTGLSRSSGQTMTGMGAELLEVGDDYSIHEGEDEDFEYYGKILDSDPQRTITVILRYAPNEADAVEQLKEWVRDFVVE